jgi:hypothetical protein
MGHGRSRLISKGNLGLSVRQGMIAQFIFPRFEVFELDIRGSKGA